MAFSIFRCVFFLMTIVVTLNLVDGRKKVVTFLSRCGDMQAPLFLSMAKAVQQQSGRKMFSNVDVFQMAAYDDPNNANTCSSPSGSESASTYFMPKPLYDTLFTFYIPKPSDADDTQMTKPSVQYTQLPLDAGHDYYFYIVADSVKEAEQLHLKRLQAALSSHIKQGSKLSFARFAILGVVAIPTTDEFIDSDPSRPAVVYHEICVRLAALLESCALKPDEKQGRNAATDWNFDKAYSALWRSHVENDVIDDKKHRELTRKTHPSPAGNEACDDFSICQPGCVCNRQLNFCGIDPRRKRGSTCVQRSDEFRRIYARKYEQPQQAQGKSKKTNIRFNVDGGYKQTGYFNKNDPSNLLRDDNDRPYKMSEIDSQRRRKKPSAGDAGKLGIVFMTKDGTLQAPILMYLAKVLQRSYGYFNNVAEFHAAAYDQAAEWFRNEKLAKHGLPEVIVQAFQNTETPPDFMSYVPYIWDANTETEQNTFRIFPLEYHYYVIADDAEEARHFMATRTQTRLQPNLLEKIIQGKKTTLAQAVRSKTDIFGVIPYPKIAKAYDVKRPDIDIHLMFQRCIAALQAFTNFDPNSKKTKVTDKLWQAHKKRDWAAMFEAQVANTKHVKAALAERALDLFSRQPRHHRCDDKVLVCKAQCSCVGDARKKMCVGGCEQHQWVSFVHPNVAMALSSPIDLKLDDQIANRINARKKNRAHEAYDNFNINDDEDDELVESDADVLDEESRERSMVVMFVCYALTMIIACLCIGCASGAVIGFMAQKTKWISSPSRSPMSDVL